MAKVNFFKQDYLGLNLCSETYWQVLLLSNLTPCAFSFLSFKMGMIITALMCIIASRVISKPSLQKEENTGFK